ncbi:protein kinase domain-containing protein [Cystobacter fuscus]
MFAGRYTLLRTLGRGGMGTVYQARDSLVGDLVALKTLQLGEHAGPEALERFRREVRLARRITHPHVARMHDLGTHEGGPSSPWSTSRARISARGSPASAR